jgi:NADP-dependent 3-hydroxy acid dehydrogenase YdfG
MNDQRGEVWQGVGIITGASSGMGEATARLLAPAAKGLVIGARRIDRIEAIAKELGDHVIPVQCDVREQKEVEKLAQCTLEHFGQIDALINNAGIAPLSSMARCRIEDWDNMIDTNIKGVLYGIAAVLPHMLLQKDGHIITVSSETARRVFPSAGVYSGTKHAVRAICEGLQRDLSDRSQKDGNQIKVTTIAPGYVKTNLAESFTYEPAKKGFEQSLESLDGALEPDDIARCIEFVLNAPSHVEVGEMTVRPVKQNL